MTQEVDLSEMRGALQQLVGRAAWGVRLGEGSFVTIEFGSETGVPLRGGRQHGEFHLWIYCTAWRLETKDGMIAGSEDARADMEAAIARLNGLALTAVDAEWPSLSLSLVFTDGLVLRTFSVFSKDCEHWHLYSPGGRVYTAGPGSQASLELASSKL